MFEYQNLFTQVQVRGPFHKGVPVATVGIGAARNAGLLAVQILASGDVKLQAALDKFKIKLAEESRAKNKNLT